MDHHLIQENGDASLYKLFGCLLEVIVRFSQFGFPVLGRFRSQDLFFHIWYCTRGQSVLCI